MNDFYKKCRLGYNFCKFLAKYELNKKIKSAIPMPDKNGEFKADEMATFLMAY